jgi:hypothetical protein
VTLRNPAAEFWASATKIVEGLYVIVEGLYVIVEGLYGIVEGLCKSR